MDYQRYPDATEQPNRPTRKKARRAILAHNRSLVAGTRLRRKLKRGGTQAKTRK